MYLLFFLICVYSHSVGVYSHSVLQIPGNNNGFNWHSWHPKDGVNYTCPETDNKYIFANWKRGQDVSVGWARNNHQGGFVRFSITKTPEIPGIFERKKSVIQYNCWETDCHGKTEWSDDGGLPAFTNICNSKLRIPDYLKDGKYTLQWMWYGGWGAFTDKNPIQTFISCTNINIKGGVKYKSYKSKKCIRFKGGDVHTKNNCAYFMSRTPKYCWCPDEECQLKQIECKSKISSEILIGKPKSAC